MIALTPSISYRNVWNTAQSIRWITETIEAEMAQGGTGDIRVGPSNAGSALADDLLDPSKTQDGHPNGIVDVDGASYS